MEQNDLMIAYCGLDCEPCPIHLATLEPDPAKQRAMRVEVARVCSEDEGTIKSRLSRAREAMLRAVRESIAAGESKISVPLKRLKDVVYVPDEAIKAVDPELETFLNVNRAEDMERIRLKK